MVPIPFKSTNFTTISFNHEHSIASWKCKVLVSQPRSLCLLCRNNKCHNEFLTFFSTWTPLWSPGYNRGFLSSNLKNLETSETRRLLSWGHIEELDHCFILWSFPISLLQSRENPYERTRGVLEAPRNVFLGATLSPASNRRRRKTVTAMDVVYALKLHGCILLASPSVRCLSRLS